MVVTFLSLFMKFVLSQICGRREVVPGCQKQLNKSKMFSIGALLFDAKGLSGFSDLSEILLKGRMLLSSD